MLALLGAPRPPPRLAGQPAVLLLLLLLGAAACVARFPWLSSPVPSPTLPSSRLFTHTGQLKLCDYGLARYFQPWQESYTPGVVTLWYRWGLLFVCFFFFLPVSPALRC